MVKRTKPTGRPPTEVTEAQWATIKAMAQDGCTHDEMAAYLGVSRRTFYAPHLKDRFQLITDTAWAKTKWDVRRRQKRAALKGNPVDRIWWGKQYLNQSDKQQVSQGPSILESVGDATERLIEVLDRLAAQKA